MSRENGWFENYINTHTATEASRDGALLAAITRATASTIDGAEARWAGSQHKSTDIVGSDIDVCVVSRTPVSVAQRQALRDALERDTRRMASIRTHVIRLAATERAPKVDVAFANATFEARPLPDAREFSGYPKRQMVARAMKLWTRAGGLPRLSGWAVEAMIVAHDRTPRPVELPLAFFDRIVDWYAGRPDVGAVVDVLRAVAHPWREEWVAQMPGQIEAISNAARALASRRSHRALWQSSADVGRWLGR